MENLSELLKGYSDKGLKENFEDMSFLEDKLEEFEKEFGDDVPSPKVETSEKKNDWLEKFLEDSGSSVDDSPAENRPQGSVLTMCGVPLKLRLDDIKKGRDLDTFYHLKRIFDHISHESGITVIGKPDWQDRTLSVEVYCHHLNFNSRICSRPSDEYDFPPPPPELLNDADGSGEDQSLVPNEREVKSESTAEFLFIPKKEGKRDGKEYKVKLEGFSPKSLEEVKFWLKKQGLLNRIMIYGDIKRWSLM
ncbi:phosphoprotein [Iriri virus]|uniref:Phosphoprotein n=1 Tax=Iriri virus TaxID=1620893 RepID=A0A0D3R191_9RHAB|nr:phosphoprotein [Iriri virus]AJR28376.1 phosphoprotein [Iriri virus]